MDHSDHEHTIDILFHPYLVHFPVAFFFLEAFLIGLWIWKRDEKYESFAYFILKLVMVMIPFVMLAGYIDAGGITPRVRLHFFSALSLFIMGTIRLVMRTKMGFALWGSKYKRFYLTLITLSFLMTGLTAHLGGLMVYF